MKKAPADNSIHILLGVTNATYEDLLTDVPKAYMKQLATAQSVGELIASAANQLMKGYQADCEEELEFESNVALLIGIMLWQTHVAALSQAPAP